LDIGGNMQDQKVKKNIQTLRKLVADINKLNIALYKEGVSYRMEDTYDEEIGAKVIEARYVSQKVEY